MSRLSVEEARELWLRADDDELRSLAQAARARFHEPDRATYMVMRIINYTNVCVAQCDYCAFYVLPNQEGGYVLSREDVFAKIDELLDVGGDLVAFNGGFNPKLPLDYYATSSPPCGSATATGSSSTHSRSRSSSISPTARSSLRGRRGAAARGRRPLGHRRRQRDPDRGLPQAARQVQVHRARLLRGAAGDRRGGTRTTATMVIGFDETLDERLEHLQRTRDFQDETDGLFSFLCWTYKPYGTAFGGREISAEEYRRWIALSRIFLDNVEHVVPRC